ncbi:MAG: porin family protein [Alphaproteobacteria bacterium]|nr:porin family protein [Alphaproteobacteria bacterium]MBU1513902.1 porin family protein [Alphaproteobacteria bacterium]MBU2094168.1 porin family protein [Alphaproteobacteria bacterium]MBU2150466.1 porin family protein [Alphaproteobacteria bacterium]MBU2307658.1 porin family protein [Alphaproteobacteria bacterium]
MKKALIAAASMAAIAAIAPAAAQAQDAASNVGAYVNLGLAHADAGTPNYEIVGGRLGYRFTPYLGIEGELATGLQGYTYHDVGGTPGLDVKTKVEHQAAAYGIGFLPISPSTDLFARVGYGTTKISGKLLGTKVADDGESWNFGVGAQHSFDGLNGIRIDYTRQEFTNSSAHANVVGASYVRKF